MAKAKSVLICIFLYFHFAGYSQQGYSIRDAVCKTYTSKIGIRERTGKNDGRDVEQYLAYVWLKPGQPWCAAFVSWTFGHNGIKRARSGGCVALMEQGRTIYRSGTRNTSVQQPQPGDVFFIWFPEKKRVAHTGFVDQWGGVTVITVEGNTNEAGSREGDGVYRKRRLKRQLYAVTTYLN